MSGGPPNRDERLTSRDERPTDRDERPTDRDERLNSATPRRAVSSRRDWALVLALLAVPMAVVPADGDLTVVSLWGFLNTGSVGSGAGFDGYPVWAYFRDQPRSFASLPASIRAWPLAIGFHLLAAASASSGVALGREDRRVTGGILALAAVASLWVSVGLATRFGVGVTAGWFTVLPIGAMATLGVVVAVYGGDLRRIVTG